MTNIVDDTEKPSLGGSALNDGLAVTKVIAGSEMHITLLMSKFNLNFCVGKDRKDLLEFAALVWDEAIKTKEFELSQCKRLAKSVLSDIGSTAKN